jgi:hypothetical protein
VIFLCPRATADSVLKIHAALNASHAALPNINLKFFAKKQPFYCHQNFFRVPPSKNKIGLKSSISFPFCRLLAIHYPARYFLQFPKFYNASRLPTREGRAVTAWEPSEQ